MMEELLSNIKAQGETISALEAENKLLKERIAELERRLGLDSKTSSKPPTSDGLEKQIRKPLSLRGQGKPKGGQKLHKGKTMQQVPNPDKIVVHPVKNCCQCGSNLTQASIDHFIKRQVFDVTIERVITEHQAEVKRCLCKAYTTACFPQEVKGPVQVGKHLQSIVLYLSEQFISKDRLSQVVEDLFSISLSDTTILKYEGQLAKNLLPFYDDCSNYLKKTAVKHGDETGVRVGGKTSWMHALCDRFVTYLWHQPRRKCMLTDIQGTFVHDHYPSYLQLAVNHAFCNGHILRELQALITYEKEEWASSMALLLRIMCHCKNQGNLYPDKVSRFERLYDHIVAQGLYYHTRLEALKKPVRGRLKRRIGHNLLLRLRDFKSGTLLFLKNSDVPFTNNQAEQDLRMVKVKQKVSGCFRTPIGVENFATIRSYIATVKKNGGNVLQAIQLALRTEIRLFQIFKPYINNQLALPPPS